MLRKFLFICVFASAGLFLPSGATETPSSAASRTPDAPSPDSGISRWHSGTAGSVQFLSAGSLVESLTANGITVQASLQDTGTKLRASVAIVNNSPAAVSFNPARFTLDELRPRLRSLPWQNPRQLAKASTRQVYSTGTSASVPFSSSLTPASFRDSANSLATPNYLAGDSQHVTATALPARTLAPHETAAGSVWFFRDKHPQELTFRIFVDDQIFEFPLSFPQPK